ncbi:MAG TPA: TatD family hydrolase [Candidatus Eremiobacteraceae bacterium]|nr:TatD family hydrolase [Candidatus Eremiobacteraceae bacterium]
MTATLVDTHAHLDGPEYASDLEQTVARANEAGVVTIVSAGQDEASSRATLDVAARFGNVAPAVGVHPHLAKDALDLDWLPLLLDDPRVVAAGEMGLDYHYDFSPRQRQRDVFARQLEWAGERDLPAIVHCREAYDDVMDMLGRHRKKGTTGVVHCFTASYDIGRQLIDEHEVYLGIGGAVTFKKATDLHDAVRRLPLERLVLETDCPYMTPVPYRGKRNEPAYLQLTCAAVATLRDTTPEAIAQATTENALRLFPRLTRQTRQ